MIDPLMLVLGYAFAPAATELGSWRGPSFGEDPPIERGRWGYRSYDCIPPGVGPGLTGTDLLVAAGLNGQLTVGRVGAIQAAAPEVEAAIRELDPTENRPEGAPPFWCIAIADLSSGSDGWWLNRAWYCLMRQPDLNVAITHKTLHHKRPLLFPLLDQKTIERLPADAAWATIHDDLTSQEDDWDQLEREFAAHLEPGSGDVPLTRLRMHDILLWLGTVGQAEDARAAGQEHLGAEA